MRLLIAIPVYNERKYVERVLNQIRSFHPDLLVVDDGSTDGTSEVLASLAEKGVTRVIRHETNRGYGQSLIDAFSYADEHGYDWVITMDCDEQHEPEMHPRVHAADRDRRVGPDQRVALPAAAQRATICRRATAGRSTRTSRPC